MVLLMVILLYIQEVPHPRVVGVLRVVAVPGAQLRVDIPHVHPHAEGVDEGVYCLETTEAGLVAVMEIVQIHGICTRTTTIPVKF